MQRFKALLIIGLLKLLALLPFSVTQGLGCKLGNLLARTRTSPVKITERNLSRCFPELDEEQHRRLVRKSLEETAKLTLEFGAMWEWPTDKTLKLIHSVEGFEYYEQAKASGKGLVVLAPHHGNWELVGLYLSTLEPMAALYRPPKIEALETYMSGVRGRHGSELVPTNKRGVIRLFSILNNAGMVGILPDQVATGTAGQLAPFFGYPARTVKLVSRLVQKTDCQVISLCAMRREDGAGFDLVFRPVDPAVYDEDLDISVAAVNRSVELCVRDRPEQYQWEYKRFKGTSVNGKGFYDGLR